jgi:hypothetical protein
MKISSLLKMAEDKLWTKNEWETYKKQHPDTKIKPRFVKQDTSTSEQETTSPKKSPQHSNEDIELSPSEVGNYGGEYRSKGKYTEEIGSGYSKDNVKNSVARLMEHQEVKDTFKALKADPKKWEEWKAKNTRITKTPLWKKLVKTVGVTAGVAGLLILAHGMDNE